MKKTYTKLIIIILCFMVSSCASITRKIQHLGNSPNSNYPAATALHSVEKPATVNLSAYKSVHTRHPSQNNMAIAFAASGGGYRAANLTLGVMLGLEKMKVQSNKRNLLQEVDYYSSVSGGGFGVGYYLTQFHNHILQHGNDDFSLNEKVKNILENNQNILTNQNQVTNPLGMDLTEFLFFGKNRGQELEKKLNDTILKTPQGSLMLNDIFIPKNSLAKVRLPYWATNATIYQNAALFPFTPDVLAAYQISGYTHNNFQYENKDTFQVPVSVGVTASASVPFAIPPTTLTSDGCKDQCFLQLLDGGLADNLGIYTALNFLLQDKSKVKILLIVDASKSVNNPYSKLQSPPKNTELFWRVVTASTDANRERIKPNINLVARELLCGAGATNVVVVYLDLGQYPAAKRVGTQLSITPQNQRLLLQTGQDLVANNKTLAQLVKQMNAGKINLGQCQRFTKG